MDGVLEVVMVVMVNKPLTADDPWDTLSHGRKHD